MEDEKSAKLQVLLGILFSTHTRGCWIAQLLKCCLLPLANKIQFASAAVTPDGAGEEAPSSSLHCVLSPLQRDPGFC